MKSTWAAANRLALDGSYWVTSQGGGRRSARKRDGGGFTSHDDGRGGRRDGILNVAGKRRAPTRRLFDQTRSNSWRSARLALEFLRPAQIQPWRRVHVRSTENKTVQEAAHLAHCLQPAADTGTLFLPPSTGLEGDKNKAEQTPGRGRSHFALGHSSKSNVRSLVRKQECGANQFWA